MPNFSNLILNGEEIPICVDARRTGSITRYVRRSCTPNLFLKHVFCGGKLHIIGFAQCSIDRLDEVLSFFKTFLKHQPIWPAITSGILA